jgi:hypothetical protein
MVVVPAHYDLDYLMQVVKREIAGNFKTSPNLGFNAQ